MSYSQSRLFRYTSTLQRATTAFAVATSLLVLPLGVAQSEAAVEQAPVSARQAHAARTGEQLTLALASPAEVVAGDAVSFTGTAPRKLIGRKVRLQRSVEGGQWVDVGVSRITGDGTFAFVATVSAGGVHQWQAVAKTKAKRKHGKIKKRAKKVHSNKASTTVFQWHSLKEMRLTASVRGNAPGGCTGNCTGFNWGSANVGANSYSQAYRMKLASSGPSVAEWNLEYKCILVRADYGLTSDTATGVVGDFAIHKDGVRVPLPSKALGQVGTAEVDISGAYRIKFEASKGTSTADGYAGWGDPQVLCLP